MPPFFDAFALAETTGYGEAPALPEGFLGAMLHGRIARAARDELARWHPQVTWKHGEELDRVCGESNASFPNRRAALIDLALEGEELDTWLQAPAEWWPLCEALRGLRRFARVRLAPGAQAVARFKRLVRRFPETHFWLDAFLPGPHEGWQGRVRLAEHDNVWLSTLGLFPEQARWSDAQAGEALAFVVGEVGAGKLIYASGLSLDQVLAGEDLPRRAWLAAHEELDEDERRLVMGEIAHGFLFTSPEEESLI